MDLIQLKPYVWEEETDANVFICSIRLLKDVVSLNKRVNVLESYLSFPLSVFRPHACSDSETETRRTR